MATTYKNAQVQGTAAVGTYTTLYSTSASTSAVISTIAVTNTASTAATYRIAIDSQTASAPSASTWIAYDSVVASNDTSFITVGLTLGSSKFLRVSSSANTVTFNAFVSEIS